MKYKRICIFGRPGSGKSTFALAVQQKTGLPLHHLDRYYFTHHWAKRDYQEFLQVQQAMVNTPAWIIDGNCLKSLEMRYARADLCIYFNFPRLRCIGRLVKRIFVTRDPRILDRAARCNERVSWDLLTYTWTYEYRLNNRLQHQLKDLRTRYPQVAFIELHNDCEVQKLIERINE